MATQFTNEEMLNIVKHDILKGNTIQLDNNADADKELSSVIQKIYEYNILELNNEISQNIEKILYTYQLQKEQNILLNNIEKTIVQSVYQIRLTSEICNLDDNRIISNELKQIILNSIKSNLIVNIILSNLSVGLCLNIETLKKNIQTEISINNEAIKKEFEDKKSIIFNKIDFVCIKYVFIYRIFKDDIRYINEHNINYNLNTEVTKVIKISSENLKHMCQNLENIIFALLLPEVSYNINNNYDMFDKNNFIEYMQKKIEFMSNLVCSDKILSYEYCANEIINFQKTIFNKTVKQQTTKEKNIKTINKYVLFTCYSIIIVAICSLSYYLFYYLFKKKINHNKLSILL